MINVVTGTKLTIDDYISESIPNFKIDRVLVHIKPIECVLVGNKVEIKVNLFFYIDGEIIHKDYFILDEIAENLGEAVIEQIEEKFIFDVFNNYNLNQI